MGSKVTIEEDSTESGIGFLIIQVMIITLKLGNVVTSKLVHHKTVDKSSTFMILEQGTLKTVILKYEIAEYNNPLDYMRMKRTQQKNLTLQNIIDAIRWGSDLFDFIAADTYHYTSINNANPRYCVDLSRKQYYARLSKLVKAGLVKRVNGRYSLTFFGIMIYDVQLEFRRAVDSHLKTNEPESSNVIPFQTKP
jgi:hypothetical protein